MELTIFDQIFYQFETIATGGVPQVRALVMSTFWILATIDACMAFLTNLEDGDHFKILIQKCLKIGFWLFFVNSWGLFCNVIKNSLIMAGSVIGSGASMSLMQHPSEIVSQGILTLDPILEYESEFTGITDVMANFGMLMACIISYLFGCLAYVLLGIQVVLTYVEFYLMCALFTVFVPFGVTKWTSFLAEKAIGGVIAYGVKLMVLSCIVSIIPDTLNAYGNGFTLTPENALTAMISLVAVGVLLAFLSWAAPALAASMMTVGPSLTAGSVAMAGAAMAGGTAIAAGGAAKAAGAVMGSGKGAAGSGGGNTSAAANAMSRGQLPPGGVAVQVVAVTALLVVQVLAVLRRAQSLAAVERKAMEEALGPLRGRLVVLVVVRQALSLLTVRLVGPPEMAVREEVLPIVLPRQQEARPVVWLAVRLARQSAALLLALQGLPLEEWPVA